MIRHGKLPTIVNYLCIPYVLFVDIFTRSFDDFVSMKFLNAVFLQAFPFIPTSLFINFGDFCQPPSLLQPPRLSFSVEIFRSLHLFCFPPPFSRIIHRELENNTYLTSSSFSTIELKGAILPKMSVFLFLKMRYWYTMIKFVCSWSTSTQSLDIFK